MPMMGEGRSEIAFFDLETTVPTRTGQGFAILEFGAILVCPRKLVELQSYSTLVRPADLSHITSLSVRCNGISREAVVSAPTFADIADVVYDLLHGRIWAGHNILRFDCARLREAFAEIGQQAPEPRGTIDSLALLTQRFGRRAGDMKMASLATYFGLGQQTHRSLDDVRMNLEVLKYCATVLFLESSLPDHFPENSWVSPNATTRSRANGKSPTEQTGQNECTATSSVKVECHPTRTSKHHTLEENHPILSLMAPENGEMNLPPAESSSVRPDPLSAMGTLGDGLEDEPLTDDNMEEEEEKTDSTPVESSAVVNYQLPHGCDDFLKPGDISEFSISVKLINFYRGSSKIQILYQNLPLQLHSTSLKVRFGVSGKFVDHAGRPRLSFVVDAQSSLCRILEKADSLAHELSVDCSSTSEWRPVVNRKPGFYNFPNIRLHLPFVTDGENTRWATEIYQKDGSSMHKLVFSRFDVAELDSLLAPGNLVDASFVLDTYDYLQNAGIRLVAKKLVVHSSQ